MVNGTSQLSNARFFRRLADLRKEQAETEARLKDIEDQISALTAELVEIAAPARVDAQSHYRNALFILVFATLLGIGFVFFAEYSLQLIGFDWEQWKLYIAGVVFWLGTLVSMDIYFAGLKTTEFSSLPRVFRILPLSLIILGVVVLAFARGLAAFSTDATADSLTTLARIAQWSGLIAQVTLSLGLDLSSGVVGWAGVRRFNKAQPIWQRYKEIEELNQIAADLKDSLAILNAELTLPPPSVTHSSAPDSDKFKPSEQRTPESALTP